MNNDDDEVSPIYLSDYSFLCENFFIKHLNVYIGVEVIDYLMNLWRGWSSLVNNSHPNVSVANESTMVYA